MDVTVASMTISSHFYATTASMGWGEIGKARELGYDVETGSLMPAGESFNIFGNINLDLED